MSFKVSILQTALFLEGDRFWIMKKIKFGMEG